MNDVKLKHIIIKSVQSLKIICFYERNNYTTLQHFNLIQVK